MMRQKLSVAIATHNEKENILKTLASVYDWVDEIFIVDGSSTDGTGRAVREFDSKKKIHLHIADNPRMFHINKQKALEMCKGEWILQLDTDEIVSEDLRNEIVDVINRDDKHIAFWIPRLNHFLGRALTKGGQYPDYTIRLYKNGVAKLPCASVHEQVEINGKIIPQPDPRAPQILEDQNISILQHPLLHFPWKSLQDYIDKGLIRYSRQEAQNLSENGFRISLVSGVKYFIILPTVWFFKTYVRHKGFVDGWQGCAYSFFSSLRYWVTYVMVMSILRSEK